MTTVSIIIPAYNQARYLAQAVESALNQTHQAVEVVVVDDGSTDDTPAVAQRYTPRPGFKYVRQANTGLPGARNRGLTESTGQLVCFLDSDDYLAPDKIAKQAALLEANPELGFVYCDIVTVDDGGTPLAEQYSVGTSQRELSGNIFGSLLQGGYFPPHTVLIRRSVLNEVGVFDPELGGHADYELWLRVAGFGHRACYQDERLAFYRSHGANMSKDSQHMAETRLAALRKIVARFPEGAAIGLNNLQSTVKDLFLANQWLHQQWEQRLKQIPDWRAEEAELSNALGLLKQLPQARLLKGQPDQKAIWEATVDGVTSKVLCLQPPAELLFELPTGAAGEFRTAVTLHPEVWQNQGSGPCEFHVRVDGRLAFVVALDPVHRPEDRCWHEIRLTVPPAPGARHVIVLETRAIGARDFRWAIWRSPSFHTGGESDHPATEAPVLATTTV